VQLPSDPKTLQYLLNNKKADGLRGRGFGITVFKIQPASVSNGRRQLITLCIRNWNKPKPTLLSQSQLQKVTKTN